MPEERTGIWVDMSPGFKDLIDDLAQFLRKTRKDFITEVLETEICKRLSALPFDVEEMLAGLDAQFPGSKRLDTYREIAEKVNSREVKPYANSGADRPSEQARSEPVEVMPEDVPRN